MDGMGMGMYRMYDDEIYGDGRISLRDILGVFVDLH